MGYELLPISQVAPALRVTVVFCISERVQPREVECWSVSKSSVVCGEYQRENETNDFRNSTEKSREEGRVAGESCVTYDLGPMSCTLFGVKLV